MLAAGTKRATGPLHSASQARALHRAGNLQPWLGVNPRKTCRGCSSSAASRQQAVQAAPTPVKRLILLRHADSEVTSKVRDHDRPLSQEGKAEAKQIAQLLSSQGWIPDLVLASNSKRTKQTLDEMAEVVAQLGEVRHHEVIILRVHAETKVKA